MLPIQILGTSLHLLPRALGEARVPPEALWHITPAVALARDSQGPYSGGFDDTDFHLAPPSMNPVISPTMAPAGPKTKAAVILASTDRSNPLREKSSIAQ
jgi:hypothetical protein